MNTFLVLSSQVQDKLLAKRERGATMVEYGLMVAAIAMVVMVVAFALGDQIVLLFQDVIAKLAARPVGP